MIKHLLDIGTESAFCTPLQLHLITLVVVMVVMWVRWERVGRLDPVELLERLVLAS